MGRILTFNIDTQEWETPSETAAVDQDIEITDSTKGVVLTSANKKWRLTVDDTGTLAITDITPP